MALQSSILFPLYIYPDPGAWDPLLSAIINYPNLTFVLIINPHNGPSSSPHPDEDYTRELKKLNTHPNVCTIGYIRTDYCKRPISEVYRDIAIYGGWKKYGLPVKGIFFDETPNVGDAKVVRYLDDIGEEVKDSENILGEQLVIHNPGTVPSRNLCKPGPDITTIFEASFDTWKSSETQEHIASLLTYGRERCAFMVHSVPEKELEALVLELRSRGGFLFVTSLTVNYYESFGRSWEMFIEYMAKT